MSEVIEDYIRRNSGMSEDAAFETFLQQDRIKSWVGTDASRRERLRREFSRVWDSLHPPSTPSRQGALVREVRQEPAPQVSVRRPPPAVAPAPAPAPSPAREAEPEPARQRLQTGAPRRLQVLCPVCSHMEVWLHEGDIQCRHCGRAYDDMLQLIPVSPVGPFAYVFGDGWQGVAKAAGVAAGLALLYMLLRWSG